jgi:hypothetical protein
MQTRTVVGLPSEAGRVTAGHVVVAGRGTASGPEDQLTLKES